MDIKGLSCLLSQVYDIEHKTGNNMERLFILSSLVSFVIANCPQSWYQYDNSCYSVFGTRATFNSALRRCASYQGNLLSVKSRGENRFVGRIISGYLDNQFWIGIYFNRTSWYWLDDETEVTWSKWVGPRSACALTTGTQKWTSERCAFYHQYICELEMKKSTTPEQEKASVTVTHKGTTDKTTSSTCKSVTRLPQSPTTSVVPKTDTVTDDDLTGDDLLDHDVTPEVIVIDRKRNPGRTHTDNRPSAIGIGSIGVGVLVCVFLGVFLLDASKLWRDLSMFRHNFAEVLQRIKRRKETQRKVGLNSTI